MKYLIFFYLIVHSLVYAATYPVMLGNTKVEIIKQYGKGKTFVHLHENEKTALAAAKTFIKAKGGSLITLRHSGTRNIVFHLRRVRYEFDPNRIFTDRGIKKTLKQYGSYSPAAHTEVSKFADKIKRLLPKNETVVAVHNNRTYSIKEYFPKHPLAKDIKALHYRPKSNYRNFYFVTKSEEYRRLKKLKFNVALQSNSATDDGSLSFYLAKKNYINIESAFGALKDQLRMLYHA
ncbi:MULTISPECIES: protein tyrosine phosphatase [unclassified Legionella]|uniref:protein tyrosine phosphatase n=1 Tax=unclassified Legionella TaxID=2622702 RepID=UPI001E505D7C|nr:protein tyrosine phosphatase [Legionella sp. 31fI33]MCC5015629.1 protein tyrosine phosphatase [Legionella sp. 31fI33]